MIRRIVTSPSWSSNGIEDAPVSCPDTIQRVFELSGSVRPRRSFQGKDAGFDSGDVRLSDSLQVANPAAPDLDSIHSLLCG